MRTARNEAGAEERSLEALPTIAGMAPRCKLLSMRVLDDAGTGQVSWIIDALDEIQRINDYGRTIVIHGVNLSVGYNFDAKWFACGQSPLCVEVDRLVRSGVVVVAAAGNSGYGYVNTAFTQAWAMGLPMTINDPGNADLAITVGSTHRDAPHRYGISYFSSKGPTGDGRMKPDLVAPGERIVSCASAQSRRPATVDAAGGGTTTATASSYTYKEDSGTSMAAPHVSGLVAAFLSIRARVHRPARTRQAALRGQRDRPAARPRVPGRRPGRPDAHHPSRLNPVSTHPSPRSQRGDLSVPDRRGAVRRRAARSRIRVRPRRRQASRAAALAPQVDDLIVISHGWNNDETEARALYTGFLGCAAAVWDKAGFRRRSSRTGVLAVFWPSKKFDEDAITAAAPGAGAAAIGEADPAAARRGRGPAAGADRRAAPHRVARLAGRARRRAGPSAGLDASTDAQDGFVAALAPFFAAGSEPDPALDNGAAGIAGGKSGSAVLSDVRAQLATGAVGVPAAGAAARPRSATATSRRPPAAARPASTPSRRSKTRR